jgi:cell division septal protein FtsQ
MSASNGSADKRHVSERNAQKNRVKPRSFLVFLKTSYKTVLLVAIVATASIVGTTLVSTMLSSPDSDVHVSGLATIKTLEVEIYWDTNGVNKRETINWGEI